jgi:hypothetical protein
MKYLKRFNENIENIENTESMHDFNDSNYDAPSKSITAAYMIIEDSEKTITVLNIKEFEERRAIFADRHIPYTIEINKVRLPKSQIEIGDEVVDKPGFNWIKIPYWLVRNNPGLKIQRINHKKRFSNLQKIHSKLDPKTIDSDVFKYLSITDKDERTLINLKSFISR